MAKIRTPFFGSSRDRGLAGLVESHRERERERSDAWWAAHENNMDSLGRRAQKAHLAAEKRK